MLGFHLGSLFTRHQEQSPTNSGPKLLACSGSQTNELQRSLKPQNELVSSYELPDKTTSLSPMLAPQD